MKRVSATRKTEEIMTISSLALYLHCSHSFIYRLLKKKQIPAFKIGSDWRFFRAAIDEWIARQYDTTNPPLTRGPKPKLS
jgi:excisionase family DNA binding protein